MNSTFFGLMAEFETAEIPLDDCCDKYFGMNKTKAYQNASMNKLPIPTYRGGSQKSKRLVSAYELASYLDEQKEKARKEWQASNNIKVA